MIHHLPQSFLTNEIDVLLVGAGGTGSFMLTGLAQLHMAMLALGHPYGLSVTVVDDDIVSEANVGRQMFYMSDIGLPKAEVLVNRINLAMGTHWKALPVRVTGNQTISSDIVIGCVDNRKARKAILAEASKTRLHDKRSASSNKSVYWLDMGNRLNDGQVVLGEIGGPHRAGDIRLPHAADLFPEIIDDALEAADDTPSCSLADALEKQSLFINRGISLYALNMLSDFFRHGQLEYHGVFMNLKNARTSPLAIDSEAWKRFGFHHPEPKPAGKRTRKAKKKDSF